jgi:hypothetical protein
MSREVSIRYQLAPDSRFGLFVQSVSGCEAAKASQAAFAAMRRQARAHVIAIALIASCFTVRGWAGACFALTVANPRHEL